MCEEMKDWVKLAILFCQGIFISGIVGVILFLLWVIMRELYKDMGVFAVVVFSMVIALLMGLFFEEWMDRD
jgi:hypothetical protein